MLPAHRPCLEPRVTQRPARRLRQLSSVAARGLDVPPGSGAFFTLHIPCVPDAAASRDAPDDAPPLGWQPAYRSEAVYGTINPEWEPLGIEWHSVAACAALQIWLSRSMSACVSCSRIDELMSSLASSWANV